MVATPDQTRGAAPFTFHCDIGDGIHGWCGCRLAARKAAGRLKSPLPGRATSYPFAWIACRDRLAATTHRERSLYGLG